MGGAPVSAPSVGPGGGQVNSRAAVGWRRAAFVVVCLCCISTVEYRVLSLIQRPHFSLQVSAALQVLHGHPFWKAYQNRLLAPGIVLGLHSLSGFSFTACYRFFSFAAVGTANAVCYGLVHRHRGRAGRALLWTILYAASFVAIQDENWLYSWDFIDLTVMLLFAWTVVVGSNRLWPLSALFVVELFNRESAMFIALWIVIDAVEYRSKRGPAPRLSVDFARLATGVLLGISGTLWTGFIRDRMCIQTSGPPTWNGVHETASGQLFLLPVTFQLFAQSSVLMIAMPLIVLGAAAFFLSRAWNSLVERAWKILLFMGALTAANFCLAYVFETRVWLTFLPFILCLAYLRQTADARGSDQTAQGIV